MDLGREHADSNHQEHHESMHLQQQRQVKKEGGRHLCWLAQACGV
jgi:hypothetical protein